MAEFVFLGLTIAAGLSGVGAAVGGRRAAILSLFLARVVFFSLPALCLMAWLNHPSWGFYGWDARTFAVFPLAFLATLHPVILLNALFFKLARRGLPPPPGKVSYARKSVLFLYAGLAMQEYARFLLLTGVVLPFGVLLGGTMVLGCVPLLARGTRQMPSSWALTCILAAVGGVLIRAGYCWLIAAANSCAVITALCLLPAQISKKMSPKGLPKNASRLPFHAYEP